MVITRNRYGKHMRSLLLILMQKPGHWYTLGRDNLTQQAAKALARKGTIELSTDGKRARVRLATNGGHAPGEPDGWVLSIQGRNVVTEDPNLGPSLLDLGFDVKVRAFKYIL